MNSSPLAAALTTRRALQEQLIESFPEMKEDEILLLDTLDGISDLDEQIARVLRAAIEREGYAKAIDEMIDTLAARKRRLAEGAQTMRAAVLWAMQEAGMTKLAFPDMSVSVGRGRAKVVVVDEAALPADMLRHPPPVPDKIKIGEALTAGRAVEGAMLGNPLATLTIRRR